MFSVFKHVHVSFFYSSIKAREWLFFQNEIWLFEERHQYLIVDLVFIKKIIFGGYVNWIDVLPHIDSIKTYYIKRHG